MNAIKTSKMDIRLRVVGIKKRQRSVKVHNFDVMKDLAYEDIDLVEYIELAARVLTENMRTVETVELYLSPWTEIAYVDEGYSMKEVRMCDPRYKKLAVYNVDL